MVANEVGGPGSEQQMADNLVKSLGPYLADQCKPHWAGTITYVSTSNESKSTSDKGAMRAASRNTKRDITESSTMTEMIKATLLPPDESKRQTVNSTRARVMHRTNFVYSKHSTTNGELYCRLPGKNPFWKGFSESFNETTTMLGQGTDTMQLFISFDGDGGYSIKVTAPGGPLYGKFESTRKATGCDEAQQEPTVDAYSLPEGRIQATSFDAEGRTSPNPTSLTGSQTLPDGKTKISWNLRLVKPKGK
jgi:hypothetical protein